MGFPYGNVRSGQAEGRNAPGPGVYCLHCPVLQDLARILEKRLLTGLSMRPLKRRSASSRQLRSMSRIKNDLRIHQSLGKENGLHHIGGPCSGGLYHQLNMTLLHVRHTTIYRYHRPVRLGDHRLMLRPRDSHDLRLIRTTLNLSPPASLRWVHDVFGNSIAIARSPCPPLS